MELSSCKLKKNFNISRGKDFKDPSIKKVPMFFLIFLKNKFIILLFFSKNKSIHFSS